MITYSSFIDPNGNGFDITDVGSLVAVLLFARLVFWGLFRSMRRALRSEIAQIVKQELRHFTQPIQPGYRNGGESLADVSHAVNDIKRHLGIEE